MAAMSGIGVSLATTARDMRTCPAAVQPAPAVIRRVHRPRRLTTRVHAGDGLPETALERALRYKRDKATGQTQTTVDPTPKPPIPPPNADWANPAAVQTASGKVESRLASRTVDLEDAANTSGVYNPIRAEGAALQTQEEEDEEDNLESSMQELAAKAEATNQRAEQALAAALEYSKQKRDEKGLTEDDTKGLSMEALTEKLDDSKTRDIVTEVEMITQKGDYRPKVSTWGMFPRPDNISKAYGGGRTIQNGGELESAEDKQARDDRIAKAVAKYKRNAGLTVEDSVAAKAEQDFSNGMRLMETGKMTMAVPFFTTVIEDMPPKSKLAGMATLQRALCWETMGKSEQAKEEYAKIARHPTGEVAKKASMMLDGFEASEFFNGEHFDFMTQRGAYKEDMIKISRSWDYQSWNTGYTPPENASSEDDPGSQTATVAVTLGLFAIPLAAVALLTALK